MVKKVLLVVFGVLILGLGVAYIRWLTQPGFQNPPNVSDTFANGFVNWPRLYVDGLGVVKNPPYHGADIRVEQGQMRLEISPDPNFANESSKPKPGAPSAERYNNAFAIGMQGYSPNKGEKVVVEFQMKVDKGYRGTTGLWLEAQDTFNTNGHMVPGGFPGAFGVSYTSSDSWGPIAGLKFEYVKGFLPLCIGNIEGVDPFKWNTYRIEWTKGFLFDQFKIFANGNFKGNCFIPFIGFQKSEIQVWADNFLVKEWFALGHLNPNVLQGTNFKDVSIAVEK